MTMRPRRLPTAQLRAGDADRDAILAQLSEHFGAGRLTVEELDERAGRALSVRTMGELDELMSDLPRPPAPKPEYRPPPPREPGAYSGLIPLGIAFAFVTSAVTIGPPNYDWFPWWTVPLAFLLLRKAVGRRHRWVGRSGGRPGAWPADR